MFSKADGWVIRQGEKYYPASLEPISTTAKAIYGIGDPAVLEERCIGIVGARRATPYGIAVSEMAGRIAAECGVVVVSGGAKGCDFAAGSSAVAAGGKTIVVSGCGADIIYPKSSEPLFKAAVETGGAVISIEKWGTPVGRYVFPKRNKVIAALSEAVIIAEAGMPSGTMSTAEVAIELGKPLYAIPGSIFSPTSKGTNMLLEQGEAFIIPDEVALELRIAADFGAERTVLDDVGTNGGRIMSALIASPERPETLSERLSTDVITILRSLADYEVGGLVCRLPDGRYAPTKEAHLNHNRRGTVHLVRSPEDTE